MSNVRVQCENPRDISLWGGHHVEWMYPQIYANGERDHITLGLTHTRAADDIRITYHAERDGWLIEQASVFEWDGEDEVCDRGWREAAFIPAWQFDKREAR